VVIDNGLVVADGDIADLLGDAELLAAHRLELPWGFDVRAMSTR
jgi:cobalt/nickel transport system ATP-binding protein